MRMIGVSVGTVVEGVGSGRWGGAEGAEDAGCSCGLAGRSCGTMCKSSSSSGRIHSLDVNSLVSMLPDVFILNKGFRLAIDCVFYRLALSNILTIRRELRCR